MAKNPVVDLKKIKTYSIRERVSKVRSEDFAKVPRKGRSFTSFYKSMPQILAAQELEDLVKEIVAAYKRGKPVIFMMGAHVIKCGLSPVIIELMKKGIISCVAMNGAGIIHDFEIALVGRTSEDVQRGIESGTFGMAKETAEFLNAAIKKGAKSGEGMGPAVGQMIAKRRLANRNLSILYWGAKEGIPVTVHVAIGTDIIHQNPSFDGGACGRATYADFQKFIEQVTKLTGGVVLNLGSAVILPEVFLKALTIARNLGFDVRDFTTATFDKHLHYRPHQNVVTRPVSSGGRGYYITGHHEVMIPLLAQAIIERVPNEA